MYKNVCCRIATAALGLTLLACAGCGPQMGAMLYHSGLIPRNKTQAQFELSQGKVAILIDDPYGSLPRSDLATRLHQTLAGELTRHEAAVSVVPVGQIARVESQARGSQPLSVRAVGEQVEADQVVHVTIVSYSLGEQAEHGLYKGQAKAIVKVCSTERRPDVRLWPKSGDGYVLEVRQPGHQVEQWGSADASEAYGEAMADRLAQRIAMLFYEHLTETQTALTTGRTPEPAE